MDKQLLIIGNGFDLTAGLPSKYCDFFEWLFCNRLKNEKDYQSIEHVFFESNGFVKKIPNEVNEKMNYWVELFWNVFLSNKDATWSDIEQTILSTLQELLTNHKNLIQYRNPLQSYSIEQMLFYKKLKSLGDEFTIKTIPKEVHASSRSSDVINANAYLNHSKYIPFDTFIEALLIDLKEVEKNFIEYMKLISREQTYIKKSQKLIKELIIKEFINEKYYSSHMEFLIDKEYFIETNVKNTQILSFNYTRNLIRTNKLLNLTLRNIHGEIDSNEIIFGIDSHFFPSNSPLTMFTKTYRLMDFSNLGLDLNTKIDYIKFFGHGLAEADYSYFISIFDGIDLYHSKTKLLFYYQVFDTTRKAIIKQTLKNSVYSLIKKYGNTFSNEDHGKNLLHKLLIEGRLFIFELKTNFLETDN